MIYHQNKKLPCQHNLMIIGMMGTALMYLLRVNLSVAIVAMAGHTKETKKGHFEESCPFNTSIQSKTSLPLIKGEFDWNEEEQGKILASFFYGYFLTNFIGGQLGDKYGGKRVFGTGILLTSLISFLLPMAAQFSKSYFSFLRMLQGMSQGIQFPAFHSLMSNWVEPSKRGFFMTRISAGPSMGTVLILFFGGWLSQTSFGWPWVFYIPGALGLIYCVAWFHMVSDYPTDHPLITEEEKKILLHEIGENKSRLSKEIRATPWKSIFTSVPFIVSVVAHFGHNFGWYCLLTELPTYLSTVHHFDVKSNGFVSALPYLTLWTFMMLYGNHVMRLSSQNIISLKTVRTVSTAIGFYCPMVLVICISLAGCNSAIVVMIICAAMGLSGFCSCGFLCTAQDLAPNYCGTLMGISNTAGTIPGFLAPLITGYIIKDQPTIMQWNKVFLITSFMYLVPCSLYLIFMRTDVQPWNSFTWKTGQERRVRTV